MTCFQAVRFPFIAFRDYDASKNLRMPALFEYFGDIIYDHFTLEELSMTRRKPRR